MVKFNKHHVTNGTVKARVHYSLDNRVDGRRCVTIYAKDYTDALGVVLADTYENHTDYQTDYFDKGKAVLFEDHPLYAAARARAVAIMSARLICEICGQAKPAGQLCNCADMRQTIASMLKDWTAATPEQRQQALEAAAQAADQEGR